MADEESKETNNSQTAPKKKNVLGIFGIIAAVVLLLLGAGLGYGFVQGSRIRNYAVSAEKMYLAVDKWSTKIEVAETSKEMKEVTDQVSSDSEKYLAELNAKAAPGKESNLKNNLIEYFTISSRLSKEIGELTAWSSEIESLSDSFDSFSTLDSSSPESLTASLEEAKVKLDETITNMESMDVPDSIQDQHNALKKVLKDMSELYAELIVALKKNDLSAISSINKEFVNSMSKLSADSFSSEELTKAYDEDVNRLDELEAAIASDITKYKNTIFSY